MTLKTRPLTSIEKLIASKNSIPLDEIDRLDRFRSICVGKYNYLVRTIDQNRNEILNFFSEEGKRDVKHWPEQIIEHMREFERKRGAFRTSFLTAAGGGGSGAGGKVKIGVGARNGKCTAPARDIARFGGSSYHARKHESPGGQWHGAVLQVRRAGQFRPGKKGKENGWGYEMVAEKDD